MSDAEKPGVQEPIPFPFADPGEARAAALARARSLVAETLRAFPDWSPPPFDPTRYARFLGIPVEASRELTGWDALLVPIRDGFRIVCNENVRSSARRRFSIGHEIAHTFFSNTGATYRMRVTKGREKVYETDAALALERLCDLAAAEMLMPQSHFDRLVREHGARAATIPVLAGIFGVSLEAAALRLVETIGGPCAAGFFHFAPAPTAADAGGRTAYRVRRLFRSDGFPFLFPEGKSVPETSVVHRASFQLDELESVEEFELAGRRCRLRVTAFPLHREPVVVEPPTVCAVFRPD